LYSALIFSKEALVSFSRLLTFSSLKGRFFIFSSIEEIAGKKYFLKYAPEGLRLLKEDLSLSRDAYPELYRLVNQLTSLEQTPHPSLSSA